LLPTDVHGSQQEWMISKLSGTMFQDDQPGFLNYKFQMTTLLQSRCNHLQGHYICTLSQQVFFMMFPCCISIPAAENSLGHVEILEWCESLKPQCTASILHNDWNKFQCTVDD